MAPLLLLPGQRDDHAEAIALFAKVALVKTSQLTQDLESILGPGTGELSLRFGIHSGPVTAGVLRGEKARFQVKHFCPCCCCKEQELLTLDCHICSCLVIQ